MTDLAAITAAKQTLFDLLADPDGVPVVDLREYVVQVFKGEPTPGIAPKPVVVTIATARVDATDWTFAVRVYVDPSTDALARQDMQDGAVDAISALLSADARFGRIDWQFSYDVQLDALIAEADVIVGREDFTAGG